MANPNCRLCGGTGIITYEYCGMPHGGYPCDCPPHLCTPLIQPLIKGIDMSLPAWLTALQGHAAALAASQARDFAPGDYGYDAPLVHYEIALKEVCCEMTDARVAALLEVVLAAEAQAEAEGASRRVRIALARLEVTP